MTETKRGGGETRSFEDPDRPANASTAAVETSMDSKPGAAKNALEEPYLLLPELATLSLKDAQFCLNKIDAFVRTGAITPVLGSEMTAADIVPGQSIANDPIYRAGIDSDTKLRRFHDALWQGRACGRTRSAPRPVEERCISSDEAIAALRASDGAIAALRLSLLKAVYTATSLYAGLWKDKVTPLHDWPSHSLPLDDASAPVVDELLLHLTDAVNALLEFRGHQTDAQEKRDHRCALLGVDGLSSAIKSLVEALKSEAPLRGTTVEWLTDVLWHVLIFDSPCYPTREELALQVSLNEKSKIPIRKVELTALASGGINQHWDRYGYAMSRTLAGLRGDSAPVSAVGPLHAALAASLNLSYSRWRDKRKRTKQPLPLAITLTTDLELERALACDPHGPEFYHVAFPMILTNVNHNGRGHLRWVVGRFRAGLSSPAWSDLTEPVDGWRLLNDVAEGMTLAAFSRSLSPALDGPLLLKASGSPLHVVKESLADNLQVQAGFVAEIGDHGSEKRKAGREDGEIRHVPATTELEILQLTQVDQWAMGAHESNAGLHDKIRSSFSDANRGWLILGHDLSEWSSRLQLFTQISLSSLTQPATEQDWVKSKVHGWTLAVVGQADEQRARLLLGLDIPLTDHQQFAPDDIATSIYASLTKVGWGTSAHEEAGR